MPNWCMNTVKITGPVNKITKLKEAAEKEELLNFLVPMTKDDPDWYHKNINAWGTKWEVSSPEVIEHSDTEITINFDTAWSPPQQAFSTWAEDNTDCTIVGKYFEPGMAFAGHFDWDGECFDEEHFSEDDPEYKDFILEEFGWEDEEDEE